MADIGTLIDFVDGNVLYAAQLDSNFAAIRTVVNNQVLHLDKSSQIITKSVTFTPDAGVGFTVSTGGATITAGGLTVTAGGITVSAGGVTVTGNSTITGTLGGLTGLTVASGGATITAGGLTITAGGLTVTAGGATITAGNLTLVAGQAAGTRYNAGDSSTAQTINWNNGNMQRSKLTGNCTFTFSNPVTGGSYYLELLQDAGGSKTVTWPSTVKWEGGTAPTLTTTGSRKDVVIFTYNGTNYLGVLYGLNFNETT